MLLGGFLALGRGPIQRQPSRGSGMTRDRRPRTRLRRLAVVGCTSMLLTGGISLASPSASWAASACSGGSSPALLSMVTCSVPGSQTLTVPFGTTTVDMILVGGGGGAGHPDGERVG